LADDPTQKKPSDSWAQDPYLGPVLRGEQPPSIETAKAGEQQFMAGTVAPAVGSSLLMGPLSSGVDAAAGAAGLGWIGKALVQAGLWGGTSALQGESLPQIGLNAFMGGAVGPAVDVTAAGLARGGEAIAARRLTKAAGGPLEANLEPGGNEALQAASRLGLDVPPQFVVKESALKPVTSASRLNIREVQEHNEEIQRKGGEAFGEWAGTVAPMNPLALQKFLNDDYQYLGNKSRDIVDAVDATLKGRSFQTAVPAPIGPTPTTTSYGYQFGQPETPLLPPGPISTEIRPTPRPGEPPQSETTAAAQQFWSDVTGANAPPGPGPERTPRGTFAANPLPPESLQGRTVAQAKALQALGGEPQPAPEGPERAQQIIDTRLQPLPTPPEQPNPYAGQPSPYLGTATQTQTTGEPPTAPKLVGGPSPPPQFDIAPVKLGAFQQSIQDAASLYPTPGLKRLASENMPNQLSFGQAYRLRDDLFRMREDLAAKSERLEGTLGHPTEESQAVSKLYDQMDKIVKDTIDRADPSLKPQLLEAERIRTEDVAGTHALPWIKQLREGNSSEVAKTIFALPPEDLDRLSALLKRIDPGGQTMEAIRGHFASDLIDSARNPAVPGSNSDYENFLREYTKRDLNGSLDRFLPKGDARREMVENARQTGLLMQLADRRGGRGLLDRPGMLEEYQRLFRRGAGWKLFDLASKGTTSLVAGGAAAHHTGSLLAGAVTGLGAYGSIAIARAMADNTAARWLATKLISPAGSKLAAYSTIGLIRRLQERNQIPNEAAPGVQRTLTQAEQAAGKKPGEGVYLGPATQNAPVQLGPPSLDEIRRNFNR
jgi:hypothetical protein